MKNPPLTERYEKYNGHDGPPHEKTWHIFVRDIFSVPYTMNQKRKQKKNMTSVSLFLFLL